MKITFNGTGASEGFPAVFCECEHCLKARTMDEKNFRTRSSCLIDEALLVDFSADTYARCLYGKLNLTKVKSIIITHSHSDHFYPQDLCKAMPPFAQNNRKAPLRIYGNESVGKSLDYAGGMRPNIASYLEFNHVQSFSTYNIDGYEITPLPAKHDPNQMCYIYVIKNNGKILLYGHDSGFFFEETWSALKDFKFDGVILDCTTGASECTYGTHMGIEDNIKVRDRMYSSEIADKNTVFILSHFAHSAAPFYDDMESLAAENDFIAAHDGFEIDI